MLEYARRTKANFLSQTVVDAVSERLAYKEMGQLLQEDRLFADLLSSMPLCFNLFGDMSRSSARTAQLVQRFVEGAPTSGNGVARFEHSPGRRNFEFIGTRTAFDFFAELGPAVLAVETKYHEHVADVEQLAPEALARCIAVTEASGIFADGWRDALIGTPLQQVWLDHLLLLSMLQHPSRRWNAGTFIIVAPRNNWSFAKATSQYRNVLLDSRTFATFTLEALVDFPEVLGGGPLRASFMSRYLDEKTMARASWQP